MLAVGLGLVQGQACVFHQGLRVAAMQRGTGQAHGAGDVDQLVVDEQRFVEGPEQLLGNLLAVFEVGVFEQDGELVTGKARQAAAGAEAVAQAPGQADQQLVAGLVAEAVVDPLEVVDVHQQQADRAVAVAGKAFVKVADERRPVAQAGQVVGVGQAFDALLRQLALGDVFVDADVVGQFAVVAVHLGDRQLAPVGLEVLAPTLEFALPAVAHGQARRGVEQQLTEVFQGR
ncbi:hypothetical protein D3C84_552690 [compost metagenome]